MLPQTVGVPGAEAGKWSLHVEGQATPWRARPGPWSRGGGAWTKTPPEAELTTEAARGQAGSPLPRSLGRTQVQAHRAPRGRVLRAWVSSKNPQTPQEVSACGRLSPSKGVTTAPSKVASPAPQGEPAGSGPLPGAAEASTPQSLFPPPPAPPFGHLA